MIEAIYLGLRKTDGIDINAFNKKFGVDFHQVFAEKIKQLEEDGYILQLQPENHCALSQKGMLFLDSIASILTAE